MIMLSFNEKFPYKVIYKRGHDWYDSKSQTGWAALSDWCKIQFEDWEYQRVNDSTGYFLFIKKSDAAWFTLRWS